MRFPWSLCGGGGKNYKGRCSSAHHTGYYPVSTVRRDTFLLFFFEFVATFIYFVCDTDQYAGKREKTDDEAPSRFVEPRFIFRLFCNSSVFGLYHRRISHLTAYLLRLRYKIRINVEYFSAFFVYLFLNKLHFQK